jgi:hypothetical protein
MGLEESAYRSIGQHFSDLEDLRIDRTNTISCWKSLP